MTTRKVEKNFKKNLKINSNSTIFDLPLVEPNMFIQSFSNALKLQYLTARNVNLVGPLPDSLGSNVGLLYLDLSFNQITEINPSISNLIYLYYM